MTTVEKTTERTTITQYPLVARDESPEATHFGLLTSTKVETDTQGDTTFTVQFYVGGSFNADQMSALYRALGTALRMPSYDPEVWEEDDTCYHHVPCAGPCGSGGLRRKRS